MTLMTKAAFATHRGVGKSAVSNWAAKGLLVLAADPEKTRRVLVDVEATSANLADKVDPMLGRPRGGPLPLDQPAEVINLDKERRELVREQKIGLRAKNLRDAGQLVAVAEVESRLAEMGRIVRERMHAVVRNHCERLSVEADPRIIRAFLDDEVDKAFDSLADQLEADAAEEIAANEALAAEEARADAEEEAAEEAVA